MRDQYLEWKEWQAVDFGHFGAENALNFCQELEASGIRSVKDLRIGELGYGNGVFAGWVRAEGGKWVGRELIPELQQLATEAGYEVIGPHKRFVDINGSGVFDLIVAFDVLEHMDLDDIRLFLGEAREALRPGGLVLARVPSGDSPFSGAIFRGDLTHRTLLGSGAVRQLALEACLEVSQVRSPVLPAWGLGPMRAVRRMGVRLLRRVSFSFIRIILMGQVDGVFSPNMIMVLKK